MECNKCGAPIPDGEAVCPACGASADEPAVTVDEIIAEAALEDDAPETAPEAEPVAPETDAPSSEPDAPADRKPSGGKNAILIGVIVVLALVAIISTCFAVSGYIGREKPAEDPVAAESPAQPSADAPAATPVVYDNPVVAGVTSSDGSVVELTNNEFNYYYWGEYYYIYSMYQSYGDYIYYFYDGMTSMFDVNQPLTEQFYSDGYTWQQYLIDCAESTYKQTAVLAEKGEAEGFAMPEDAQASLDETFENLKSYAAEYGYTDIDAYLSYSYGPGATYDSFYNYLYRSYYASAYSDEIYYGFTFTDEEMDDFFRLHKDEYESGGYAQADYNVDVRHILISNTDEEGNDISADAEAEAERILALWEDGDATEESFIELVTEYSADTGSVSAGGLYEDVYPGQMVESFSDWCFDEARQTGDTGIVETEYGYHIMYFVGQSDSEPQWKTVVTSDLCYEAYADWFETVSADFPISFDIEQVTIHDLPEDPVAAAAEEAAAQAAAQAEAAAPAAEAAPAAPAEAAPADAPAGE